MQSIAAELLQRRDDLVGRLGVGDDHELQVRVGRPLDDPADGLDDEHPVGSGDLRSAAACRDDHRHEGVVRRARSAPGGGTARPRRWSPRHRARRGGSRPRPPGRRRCRRSRPARGPLSRGWPGAGPPVGRRAEAAARGRGAAPGAPRCGSRRAPAPRSPGGRPRGRDSRCCGAGAASQRAQEREARRSSPNRRRRSRWTGSGRGSRPPSAGGRGRRPPIAREEVLGARLGSRGSRRRAPPR